MLIGFLTVVCVVHAGGEVNVRSDVTIVKVPHTAGQNAHYVENRPPLMPDPLIKLPIGSIRPGGWLRQQLVLMRDGMTGRLPEVSKWCEPEGNAWMSAEGLGNNGWEELPYWLRGFADLGYVLQDAKIIADARRWIDGILSSQRSDGWFGPRRNVTAASTGVPSWESLGHTADSVAAPDVWPNMVVVNVLQSHYEATGDERVIPFLTRYFRWQLELPAAKFLPASWQKWRAGDDLASILWLYNRTGDSWLLDLARKTHHRAARWDKKIASWHGVNIAQGFREPAIFWALSGDRADLDAAERNYANVMALYGQVPGGMFGADENCRPGYHGPRQGAETCSMVEFMHSDEMLLSITGDITYADRCEDVAFNSLPVSMTPDHKGLHYLTGANMVQLDRSNKAPGLENGGNMLAYDPQRFRCCQHNHAFGWPYYAEHLWMATRDNGLAAALYCESEVTAKVADGVEVTIAEKTGYPFDETVALTVSTPKKVRFPLYLRVPGWCENAGITINGEAVAVESAPSKFIRIEREWSDGDQVRLELPMRIEIKRWRTNANSLSVRRGPLWYSLKIGEKWTRYGGTDEWPAREVYPTTPWNYGLMVDESNPAASFKTVRKSGRLADQPFTPDDAPIELVARGKRIPNWQLDQWGLVGKLQSSPVRCDEPEEQITLIPMGCARLRISAFPWIGEGADAREWVTPPPPRHEASYYCDDINALSDDETPSGSADHSIPRFTWWPRRGTREWVTYRFDKPTRVSACELYWFDDAGRGQCRAPASWKVFYREGDSWREVSDAKGHGTELNRFNRVEFEPVETTELKVEVQLKEGFCGGILEWRLEN